MLTSVKFLLLSTLSQIVSSLSVDVSLTSLSSVLFPYKSISVYNEEKIKEKSFFFVSFSADPWKPNLVKSVM